MPTPTERRTALYMALTLACSLYGAEALAANARSYQGTITNNQTHDGGNYYDQSSADRSNVHLRPLAIDPRHNSAAESGVRINTTTVVTPAPVATPTPLGQTRIYNTEPTYHAPQGTVSTTTYTATPAWTDPADVNARNDAGVIITYPVLPTDRAH